MEVTFETQGMCGGMGCGSCSVYKDPAHQSPLPFTAIQVVCRRRPLSTWAVALQPGHLPQRSVCPGTPPTTSVARAGRGTLTPVDRQHHLCHIAIKECGAFAVGPQAPPAPLVGRSGSFFCDLKVEPLPLPPLVGSASGSLSLPTGAWSTGHTRATQAPPPPPQVP